MNTIRSDAALETRPLTRRRRAAVEGAALWHVGWPIMISQMAAVGMGVADVAMTGHAGPSELAAVALGSSLWTMAIVTVMGMMMAVNTLISPRVGANAHSEVAQLAQQAIWFGLIVGVLASLGVLAGTGLLGRLEVTADIRHKAVLYVLITSTALPALSVFRALSGYTTALHRTKPLMVISLAGLAFNVFGNWVLIYGHLGFPALGGPGCAVATAAGLWLSLIMLWVWILRGDVYRQTQPLTHWRRPAGSVIAKMLRLGSPIGVTYFAEVSAFSSIALLVARFGADVVSAHQIALNFISLIFMVPLSIGTGLVTRVGFHLGRQDVAQARFAAWLGIGASVAFAIVSAIGIATFRHWVARFYTSDATVQDLTSGLLLLAAMFQLSDSTQVTAACAIRGYQVTRTPMLIHLTAFWGVALPVGCLLGLRPFDWLPYQPMQANGFWMGLICGLTAAAALLVALLAKISSPKNTVHVA